jgi:quercetin dioxygenase-like cupin family protein
MKKGLSLILVSLIAMSAVARDVPKATVEQLVRSSKSWDGTPLPNYPKGIPEVTILKVTVPPRTRLAMHRHPVINAGVLLTGELTVETEAGDVLRMTAGDTLVEVVDKWHYGRNDGDTPAEIIVFYAGVQGSPVTMQTDGAHSH